MKLTRAHAARLLSYMRTPALLAMPAVALIGIVGALDVGVTSLDAYSRDSLGPRYVEFSDYDEEYDDESYDPGLDLEEPSSAREAFLSDSFNPLSYGSISPRSDLVFATTNVEDAWPYLDPAFSNRIVLKSRYPFVRVDEGSEEIQRVLAAAKLSGRYKNVAHSFELISRAAAEGRHDDVDAFLRTYKDCIKRGACEGYNFYEQAVHAIFDVYTVPAAALLAKGHCARARYLNAIPIRMLAAIDPPRSAADENTSRIYMISAIAEQAQCPGNGDLIMGALDGSMAAEPAESTEISGSTAGLFEPGHWEGSFPALFSYTSALQRFRKRQYAQAFLELNSIDDTDGRHLHDMAKLVQIRALFQMSQGSNRGAMESGYDAAEAIAKLSSAISIPSLRSDALEYGQDLTRQRQAVDDVATDVSRSDIELAVSK